MLFVACVVCGLYECVVFCVCGALCVVCCVVFVACVVCVVCCV